MLPEQCCACLIHTATAQLDSEPAQPALFCTAIFSADGRTVFEQQCMDRGGSGTCVSPPTLTTAQDGAAGFCEELLLVDFNIACPGEAAPVPLLGAGALAGLAVGLAALGAWAARRRAARP
jgi:hypothetical protein